jgi:hypothetical protein
VIGELNIELKDTNLRICVSGRDCAAMRFSFDTPDYSHCSAQKRSEKQIVVDRNEQTVRPYIGAFIAKAKLSQHKITANDPYTRKICDGTGSSAVDRNRHL